MLIKTISVNVDDSTAVVIGVAVGVAALLILIVVIGLLLYRRYKFKKCKIILLSNLLKIRRVIKRNKKALL